MSECEFNVIYDDVDDVVRRLIRLCEDCDCLAFAYSVNGISRYSGLVFSAIQLLHELFWFSDDTLPNRTRWECCYAFPEDGDEQPEVEAEIHQLVEDLQATDGVTFAFAWRVGGNVRAYFDASFDQLLDDAFVHLMNYLIEEFRSIYQ